MKLSHKRYTDCLNAIYEDCQRHGSVTNMRSYMKTYGVNLNTSTVMVKLGILQKNKRNFSWHMRKPDSSMVIQVLDAANKYCNTSKLKNEQASISKNLVKINFDDLLDAFSMLPSSIPKEARKKLAKDMVAWKNQ